MAYRCVHCSAIYEDGSKEIISGCKSCKSKFFFYIKPEKLAEIQNQPQVELSLKEKSQIEEDVREIAGIKDHDEPVYLDFESIKVIKPGKYLLDLPKLFAPDKPKIYQLEDGKYIVDLASQGKGSI